MNYIFFTNELYHHGVKGMKWGIRKESDRTPKTKLYKSIDDIVRPVLSPSEYAHVLGEVATHITPEQKHLRVFTKNIGKYVYTILNNFDNTYDIIGKREIVDTYFELFREMK